MPNGRFRRSLRCRLKHGGTCPHVVPHRLLPRRSKRVRRRHSATLAQPILLEAPRRPEELLG